MTTLDDLIGVERRLPRAGELYLDLDTPNTILCVEDHREEDDAKLVLDFSAFVVWLEAARRDNYSAWALMAALRLLKQGVSA